MPKRCRTRNNCRQIIGFMSDVELSDNFVGKFYLSDLTTMSYILNESLS